MRLTTVGLDVYSSRKRLIRRDTRIIIDRDVGKRDVPLANLAPISVATRLGALVPRFPVRTRVRGADTVQQERPQS
jgi:hypothetical protein